VNGDILLARHFHGFSQQARKLWASNKTRIRKLNVCATGCLCGGYIRTCGSMSASNSLVGKSARCVEDLHVHECVESSGKEIGNVT
jgi:hypothetical protein